jgi:hypothetical protein
MVKRSASRFAPNKSGLSLIGETNSLQPFIHIESIGCCLVHCLSNTNLDTLQDLHWIMLHPPSKSNTNPSKFATKEQNLQRSGVAIITNTTKVSPKHHNEKSKIVIII